MNQTTAKAATAHEHHRHEHEGLTIPSGYCCVCDGTPCGEQPSDPGEPRRAGAGRAALDGQANLVELLTRFVYLHDTGNHDHDDEAWTFNVDLAKQVLARAREQE